MYPIGHEKESNIAASAVWMRALLGNIRARRNATTQIRRSENRVSGTNAITGLLPMEKTDISDKAITEETRESKPSAERQKPFRHEGIMLRYL